jgi:hypothetical protein
VVGLPPTRKELENWVMSGLPTIQPENGPASIHYFKAALVLPVCSGGLKDCESDPKEVNPIDTSVHQGYQYSVFLNRTHTLVNLAPLRGNSFPRQENVP